jgi:hypothetical protein
MTLATGSWSLHRSVARTMSPEAQLKNATYILEIQSGKRLNGNGIGELRYVEDIQEKDKKVVAKFCQRWAVDVLGNQKKKELVAAGTYYH